jgi:hypothetical protein
MNARVANVVFDVPAPTREVYAESARGIADIYAELLGLQVRTRADIYREANYEPDEGDELDPVIENDHGPGFAFEGERRYRPPHWPDPDHPAQVHLDIAVADLDAAHGRVLRHGARLLLDAGDHRTYADRVGHPFCLYPGASGEHGRIARIVFDCYSPRALAAFYGGMIGPHRRVIDTPELVEIAWEAENAPAYGFHHVLHRPPRWPDPAHPQQVHVDYEFTDASLPDRIVELGAIRLPYMGGGFVYADPAGHPFCMGE